MIFSKERSHETGLVLIANNAMVTGLKNSVPIRESENA
jgi:hypothetical protein